MSFISFSNRMQRKESAEPAADVGSSILSHVESHQSSSSTLVVADNYTDEVKCLRSNLSTEDTQSCGKMC